MTDAAVLDRNETLSLLLQLVLIIGALFAAQTFMRKQAPAPRASPPPSPAYVPLTAEQLRAKMAKLAYADVVVDVRRAAAMHAASAGALIAGAESALEVKDLPSAATFLEIYEREHGPAPAELVDACVELRCVSDRFFREKAMRQGFRGDELKHTSPKPHTRSPVVATSRPSQNSQTSNTVTRAQRPSRTSPTVQQRSPKPPGSKSPADVASTWRTQVDDVRESVSNIPSPERGAASAPKNAFAVTLGMAEQPPPPDHPPLCEKDDENDGPWITVVRHR